MIFLLFSLTQSSHISEPVCPIFPVYQRAIFSPLLTHPILPYIRVHLPDLPLYISGCIVCCARKQKKARASKGGSALAVAEAPLEEFNPMKIPINSVRVGSMDGTFFFVRFFFLVFRTPFPHITRPFFAICQKFNDVFSFFFSRVMITSPKSTPHTPTLPHPERPHPTQPSTPPPPPPPYPSPKASLARTAVGATWSAGGFPPRFSRGCPTQR